MYDDLTTASERVLPDNPYYTLFATVEPRRFFARSLCLLVFPAGLTAYYVYIWKTFLSAPVDGALNFSWTNGKYIYYSWFVLGVFGLALGKFGMLGIESAMLENKFWAAPNNAGLAAHRDGAWSDVGGWVRIVYWPRWLRSAEDGKRHRPTHRLFHLLSLLSLFYFAALPLSGLVFEISDGYVADGKAPEVQGNTMLDLQDYTKSSHSSATKEHWSGNQIPSPPRTGILYTAPGMSRDYDTMKDTPNSFPLDTKDKLDFFVAPQGNDTPIAGNLWGMRVTYQCNIVKAADDFTILSQRSESTWDKAYQRLVTPSNNTIYTFGTTAVNTNVWQFAQMGISTLPAEGTRNLTQADNFDLDSSPDVDVIEYILWQKAWVDSSAVTFQPNTSWKDANGIPNVVPPVIEQEVNDFKSLRANPAFFKIKDGTMTNETLDNYSRLGSLNPPISDPIGVRCRSVSAYGNATLDPRDSTFSGFTPWAADLVKGYSYVARQSWTAALALRGSLGELFPSADVPSPQKEAGLYHYTEPVDSDGLHRSIMMALGWSADMLMFDEALAQKRVWKADTASSSSPGKIITKGVVPYLAPLVLFCLWTAGSIVLSVTYGFRRRRFNRLEFIHAVDQ